MNRNIRSLKRRMSILKECSEKSQNKSSVLEKHNIADATLQRDLNFLRCLGFEIFMRKNHIHLFLENENIAIKDYFWKLFEGSDENT